MKKLLALLLAVAMLCASCIALAEEDDVVAYPEVIEGLDFGGQNVYIYTYWPVADRKAEPSDEDQLRYDYIDWLNETYNVNIVETMKGDWGSQVQELINFNGSPDGSLCLFILAPDFVGTPMVNAQFAELKLDPADTIWNQSAVKFATYMGKVYGVATGHSEPRGCLFFNKTVLTDAGINWDEIYDMQADGTWTWEAFEALLKQIQKDTDNDGVTDVWGMTGSNVIMYRNAVFNNGGTFFDFNEEGKLAITAGSDNTLEALTWSKDIFNTYFYQQPADGQWDYYKEAFKQGNIGFFIEDTYNGFNAGNLLADWDGDWGCVAFPVGPKGTTYMNAVSDNITVIPNVYDEETVAKLLTIYKLYQSDTPGLPADSWEGNKYNFTDDRAVDETYAMLREAEHCIADAVCYIGSINDVEGQDFLWNLGGATPAELLEAKTPVWQGLLDAFNGDK